MYDQHIMNILYNIIVLKPFIVFYVTYDYVTVTVKYNITLTNLKSKNKKWKKNENKKIK